MRPPRPQYARMTAREPMTIQVTSIVPILRIFDIAKGGNSIRAFSASSAEITRRTRFSNTLDQLPRGGAPATFFRTAGFNLKLEMQRDRKSVV